VVNRALIISVVVGIILFLSDLAFGWLTLLSGPIPVIFIMAIIIGAIAGTYGEALVSTMVTWIVGILIGILIAPIIFADFLNPDQTYLGLFIFVFIYSLRGTYTWTFEGNIVEIIVVGLVYLLVMLIVTPVIYLFSFAFSAIGVVIGKFIRSRTSGSPVEPMPVMQSTPVVDDSPSEDDLAETAENQDDATDSSF
jgi:hypothetical protein